MTHSLPRAAGVIRTAAVAATLLVGLGGCAAVSPSQTQTPYAPSDGVQADIGDLGVRNLIVLSSGKGAPGKLIGALVNKGSGPTRVTFTSQAGQLPSLNVPGDATLNLQDQTIEFTKLEVLPGLLVPVTVSSDSGSQNLNVPVLDGTLPEYKTLVPAASASATK